MSLKEFKKHLAKCEKKFKIEKGLSNEKKES